MDKQKLVIKIIGWFFLIFGVINVIEKLVPLVTGKEGGQLDMFNLVGIITGIAILKMKKWGRILGIVLSAIGLALFVIIYAMQFTNILQHTFLLISSSAFVVIYIFTIYYFIRPEVKEQFK